MKRTILKALASLALLPVFLVSCENGMEVKDEDSGVYSFTVNVGNAVEGRDIPVRLTLSDAGYTPDNDAWGDPYAKAYFFGEVTDSYGRTVDNAVFYWGDGVIGGGSVVEPGHSGHMDIVLGALRKGEYTLRINLRTRYTVDTWGTASFTVKEGDGNGGERILVDDFTLPSKDNGSDVDESDNVILDLRFFNERTPFIYNSIVRPSNATDKTLVPESSDPSVCEVTRADGYPSRLVFIPKKIGLCTVTVVSADGNARRTVGVRVIETRPDADGFTLPTDPEEKDPYTFDIAGRLELEINDYNASNPFSYTCKPIPSNATALTLTASSDNEEVLTAAIRGGNTLVLTPVSPGYANVTVSTSDGAIVRKMRVAVISTFTVTLAAEESAPSEEDRKHGVFPCRITMKASSQWLPKMMHVEVYGKVTGRVDLTDSADYFRVEELKNARSAFYTFEEKVPVVYLSNGNSAYNVYSRLMSKLVGLTISVHHSADYPHYYDYDAPYQLSSIILVTNLRQDYDTNIYRGSIVEAYDDPANNLYRYLH